MIRLLLTCIALCTATLTSAQSLPALYDVQGVSADDTLNIRLSPNSSADIIGALGPDETGIEVTEFSESGNWARLNEGETSGWVATRFLSLQQDYPYLPMASLMCFGTEPFWSLEKPQVGNLTLSVLGDTTLTWQPSVSLRAQGRTDRFSTIGVRESDSLIVTFQRESCSDGMSDRMFGIATDVIITGEDAKQLSGCCMLQTSQ